MLVHRRSLSLMQLITPQLHVKLYASQRVSNLCNHSAGSSALVSPGWWQDSDGLVVTRETMNSGLDKNKTELGVLVLSVALEMLAYSNGLNNPVSISLTNGIVVILPS